MKLEKKKKKKKKNKSAQLKKIITKRSFGC
jgi:hypothetical protein